MEDGFHISGDKYLKYLNYKNILMYWLGLSEQNEYVLVSLIHGIFSYKKGVLFVVIESQEF